MVDHKISVRLNTVQYQNLQGILDYNGVGRIHEGNDISEKIRTLITVLSSKIPPDLHPTEKPVDKPVIEEKHVDKPMEEEPEPLPPEPEKPRIPLPEHMDFGWETKPISEGELRCYRKKAIIPLNMCDPASCKRLYPTEAYMCGKLNQ